MAGFIVFIIIIALIAAASNQSKSTSTSGGPNISMNEIVYPADIKCDKCEEIIPVTPYTIQSDTWNLKCPHCKEIGFKHPKSEERSQQLDDMMNW